MSRSVDVEFHVLPVCGAVFIAVGFLHLLGDAVEQMEEFSKDHGDYPFALLFCAFGFLFTLCVDELGHSLSAGHSHGSSEKHSGRSTVDDELEPLVAPGDVASWTIAQDDGHAPTVEIEMEGGPSAGSVRKRTAADGVGAANYGTSDGEGTPVPAKVDASLLPRGLPAEMTPLVDGSDASNGKPAPIASIWSSVVLTIIFSFHSFFEGLALGIDNNTGSMIETAVGILAHKGLAGFALGVSVLHGGMLPRSHYFAVMTIFATMSPLGIVVGIVLSSWTSPFWLACCFSLASGTFLFIGFMEIVMKVGGGSARLLCVHFGIYASCC